MARRGEKIYKRRHGRYEGRYVIGKNREGKTRFGYVYARQYAEVRRLLLEKKILQQCSMKNTQIRFAHPLTPFVRDAFRPRYARLNEYSPSVEMSHFSPRKRTHMPGLMSSR